LNTPGTLKQEKGENQIAEKEEAEKRKRKKKLCNCDIEVMEDKTLVTISIITT